jgi:acyl-CoA thioester hydrolase
MAERDAPGSRSDYATFRTLATRWEDNDSYGHMNNVVHYSLFDTTVNATLIEAGVFDLRYSPTMFFVVETGCRYRREIAFPDIVTAGLRVATLGTSSIRYELGLFRNDESEASAEGFLVHVNVDRVRRRPLPIDTAMRDVLSTFLKNVEN